MENLEPAEAMRIAAKRRCSDCWELLQEQYDSRTRKSTVSCSTPGCPCRGHVSIEFVEDALAESGLKRREVERVLGECGAVEWIAKPVRRPVETLMADLGY